MGCYVCTSTFENNGWPQVSAVRQWPWSQTQETLLDAPYACLMENVCNGKLTLSAVSALSTGVIHIDRDSDIVIPRCHMHTYLAYALLVTPRTSVPMGFVIQSTPELYVVYLYNSAVLATSVPNRPTCSTISCVLTRVWKTFLRPRPRPGRVDIPNRTLDNVVECAYSRGPTGRAYGAASQQ
jgi:hypothetical protein